MGRILVIGETNKERGIVAHMLNANNNYCIIDEITANEKLAIFIEKMTEGDDLIAMIHGWNIDSTANKLKDFFDDFITINDFQDVYLIKREITKTEEHISITKRTPS